MRNDITTLLSFVWSCLSIIISFVVFILAIKHTQHSTFILTFLHFFIYATLYLYFSMSKFIFFNFIMFDIQMPKTKNSKQKNKVTKHKKKINQKKSICIMFPCISKLLKLKKRWKKVTVRYSRMVPKKSEKLKQSCQMP